LADDTPQQHSRNSYPWTTSITSIILSPVALKLQFLAEQPFRYLALESDPARTESRLESLATDATGTIASITD